MVFFTVQMDRITLHMINQIRKQWMQGDFDAAINTLEENEFPKGTKDLELLFISLFQGDITSFNKIAQNFDQDLPAPYVLSCDILLLHRLMSQGQVNEVYYETIRLIEERVDTIRDDPYFSFWYAIFLLLKQIKYVQTNLQKSLNGTKDILDIIPNDEQYSFNYIYIAVHNNLGEFLLLAKRNEEALHHMELAKKRALETNMKVAIGEIYSQLGKIYHNLEKWDLAIHHYREALIIPYLKEMPYYRAMHSFRLFWLYQKMGLQREMQEVYDDFWCDVQDGQEGMADQTVKIMQAELLLSKKRRSSHAEAERIYHQLDADPNIYYEYMPYVKLKVLEFLIEELADFKNDEIIEDINKKMQDLEEMIQQWESDNLSIELLIIKSKLQLVTNDVQDAYDTLQRALQLASKNENEPATDQINEELQNLEIQINEWKSLLKQSSSIEERIYDSKVKDYIASVFETIGSI